MEADDDDDDNEHEPSRAKRERPFGGVGYTLG